MGLARGHHPQHDVSVAAAERLDQSGSNEAHDTQREQPEPVSREGDRGEHQHGATQHQEGCRRGNRSHVIAPSDLQWTIRGMSSQGDQAGGRLIALA